VRLEYDERLPYVLLLGGGREEATQKRDAGQPRNPGAIFADAVSHQPRDHGPFAFHQPRQPLEMTRRNDRNAVVRRAA
jgi:hypothetical protein